MGKREWLERNQILVYAIALIVGLAVGLFNEQWGQGIEAWISPLLAVLLYGMFTLIPFLKLREALANGRFIAALLLTNFVVVPLTVWGLLALFPQPEAITIGVCLVLLTPCIDYVIVFTALGKGNEQAMTAATPVLFVVQMVLLPVYLRLFAGKKAAGLMEVGPFVEAFLLLIVLPLAAAILTQLWGKRGKQDVDAQKAGKEVWRGTRRSIGTRVQDAAAWIPVPFMALVLIAVTASQIGRIADDPLPVLRVLPIYALFMLLMPLLARVVGRLMRLDAGDGRALIFSSFTRNSLVVLPLALALPGEAAGIAAAVIVAQTLIELIGELIYVRAVPKLLWRDHGTA
ncbi:arsenic resistance protein [Saccharibacillus sacchari]|uniref:arsenic resistance protein n=1 Tax=Saccharibacillus sacchari TaxID=456493 RepID=UPI0004B84A9F|nr:arsenic resistance protein [Saccharibacillus sacchari]